MKTRASQSLLASAVMSLGLAVTGCSFVFSRGPDVAPANMTADTPVKCSRSAAAPVIDTVLVLTHVGSGIWGLTQSKETFGGDSTVRTAVIAADFALATVHLLSAVYGYSSSASCREAKQREAELVDARRKAAPSAAPEGDGLTASPSREVFWTAWTAGREATACPEALGLLTSDAECAGAACRAPIVLARGYEKRCPMDTDTRISLYRMRRRWEEAAGATISACLMETYRALTDPAKATALPETCANEGRTEAALRDAARRHGAPPNLSAPSSPR